MSITPDGTPSISARPEILSRAEIIASGFLVSSTAPASARYSRERDSDSRISTARNHEIAITAMPTTMASALPFLVSSDDILIRLRPTPRKTSSPAKEITPATTTAMTIRRTSPLRICVSSCASTASTSWSLSWSSRPVVTVTVNWLSLTPLAKALSASLCMIASFGIGSPREMQRFSSIR